MLARSWPVFLGLLLLTSGCLGLGGVSPAVVPSEDLPSSWSQTDQDTQGIAMGLGELETLTYEANSRATGVVVATLNDVPLLDERSRVEPRAIQEIESRYGVQLEESGTTTLELINHGSQVEGTEYDVQGIPVDAKAVLFEVGCDPFVLVIAYGTTSDTRFTDPTYGEAKEVARHVVCPG